MFPAHKCVIFIYVDSQCTNVEFSLNNNRTIRHTMATNIQQHYLQKSTYHNRQKVVDEHLTLYAIKLICILIGPVVGH